MSKIDDNNDISKCIAYSLSVDKQQLRTSQTCCQRLQVAFTSKHSHPALSKT